MRATTNGEQADSPNKKRSQNEHGDSESAEEHAGVQCVVLSLASVGFSTDTTCFMRTLSVGHPLSTVW